MFLSQSAYQRARQFVKDKGRPLEIARLERHFESAPAQIVLIELEKFQNPDSGFGRGLEPDLRILESSALCTEFAFQIWREMGSPRPAGCLASAIPYLLQTLDSRHLSWRIVPRMVKQIPQAPWWNEDGMKERIAYQLNPTAQLLGTLYDFRQDVPQDLLGALTDNVIQTLNESQEIVMHDLLCCKYLAETENLDSNIRRSVLYHLERLLETTVSRNPDEWTGYRLRPAQVADHPKSPFYPLLSYILPKNLDYEVAEQQEDGSWAPNWAWEDIYAQEWMKARQEWAGVLTVERLLLLHRYKKIEGLS